MFVLMKTGERAAFDRIDVRVQRDDTALETVKPQLERYYGITIHDRTAIPVAGQDSYQSAITLPDEMTAQCLIVADGTYEIACGNGYDLTTLRRLVPADGSAS
jgi:hypothetical protein